MDNKDKGGTAQLKKISTNIDTARKNIESNVDLSENLSKVKYSFGQLEGLIKGQTQSFEAMKSFSHQNSFQSSKNLELKKFFNDFFDKARSDIRSYFQVIKECMVVSYKTKQHQNWQKVEKQMEKTLGFLREDANSSQKMYIAVSKMMAAKDSMVAQLMRLMIYRKNLLWRDLNAPYNDYVHGQIKAMINLMKQSEEKYNYVPYSLQFQQPKYEQESIGCILPQLFRIVLIDQQQLISGLKNYAKLNETPEIIENITKNQHIVKGLREKIEALNKQNQIIMEKYRALQLNKGKVASGSSQQKSLLQKIEDNATMLNRKEQEILDLKQNAIKIDAHMSSLKQKNKELQDQLSKWHKLQLPKIKQMQGNQKSILEQFHKIKRDIQTYGTIAQNEREEKIKTHNELKKQKKIIEELAFILGRERRKIKQLYFTIAQKQKINLELIDHMKN